MTPATPTPRTDAAIFFAADTTFHPGEPIQVVAPDVARQLERELAAALYSLEENKRAIVPLCDRLAAMTESRDDAVDKLEQERAKVGKLRAALDEIAGAFANNEPISARWAAEALRETEEIQ